MMEKSLFERMGGTYEMRGDYRLPCLALPAEEKPVGVWGQRHLRYIQQYRKALRGKGTAMSLVSRRSSPSCGLHVFIMTSLECVSQHSAANREAGGRVPGLFSQTLPWDLFLSGSIYET